jgi:phosphonoacetaldehyde hydrolase
VTTPTRDATIRLVIFDWAGTVVDHGSIAPIAALMAAFAEIGIELTERDARGPMGLSKRDHIDAILQLPLISEQWKRAFGHLPTAADRDSLYERFLPRQANEARRRTALIPGVSDCCTELRKRGIKIGTTTGYPRAIGKPVAESARLQGFAPDHCVFPDDVSSGRPAPWMIFRNMEATGIAPPASVVKVGDTVPDIEEGRNAGAWTVSVTESGSEIGLDLKEWQALTHVEQSQRSQEASKKLLNAGAHAVLPSVANLPDMIDTLNARLSRGEQP